MKTMTKADYFKLVRAIGEAIRELKISYQRIYSEPRKGSYRTKVYNIYSEETAKQVGEMIEERFGEQVTVSQVETYARVDLAIYSFQVSCVVIRPKCRIV